VLDRRLAAGPYALYRAFDELTVNVLHLDPSLLADVDTPDELRAIHRPRRGPVESDSSQTRV
jgi:hypothetical protein